MLALVDPLAGRPLLRDGTVLRNDLGAWPILGGIPVLVPDPARWLAARRTHVLGALAEVGRCDPEDVALVRLFADEVAGVAADLDPDDFLADEEGPIEALHPAMAALLGLRTELPERLAAEAVRGPVLEVGCGAGTLTRRLSDPVVLDRSLRALLRATATGGTPILGDAAALPFPDRSFRTVVAANLVDLLDDPAAFASEAFRVSKRGGTLLVATPDPGLGAPGDAVDDLLADAGFTLGDVHDAVPWVRAHGPRHAQLYLCRVRSARRP